MEKCKLCGIETKEYDIHHIISKSDGGDDSENNKIKICKDCHYKIHHPNYIIGDDTQFNQEYKQAIDENIFSDGWGILPNKIARDSTISPGAKILYCEISSLCASKGYCWANNEYFSKLFNVSKATISEWITQLEKYLTFENRTSYMRRIRVHTLNINAKFEPSRKLDSNHQENLNVPSRKLERTIKKTLGYHQENLIHNSNSNSNNKKYNENSISENKDDESSRFLITKDSEQKIEKEKETDIRDEKTKNDVAKNQRPPSDLEIIEKYFIEKYEKKYGNKPDWVFGKDRSLIKQLLASQKVDVILKKIDMYFENEYWFNKKSGRNFGLFRSHYNEIVEIEKPYSEMTAKEAARVIMRKIDERKKIINLGDFV